MKLPTVMTQLVVSGDDWRPAELSAALNIEPSEQRIKGTRVAADRPPARVTEWIYVTQRKQSDNIDDPIANLLVPFRDKSAELCRFVREKNLTVTVNCLIEIWEERPEFFISCENVGFLAELRANLGFDVYCYKPL